MKSSLLTAGIERSTITMRIEIHVDKLYRYERKAEPCFIGIPMSAQTGFPSFYCDDYTDRMDFFTDGMSEHALFGIAFKSCFATSEMRVR